MEEPPNSPAAWPELVQLVAPAPPKILYLGFCGVIDLAAVGKIAGAFNQAVNATLTPFT